jgi:hypothetical protein
MDKQDSISIKAYIAFKDTYNLKGTTPVWQLLEAHDIYNQNPYLFCIWWMENKLEQYNLNEVMTLWKLQN